MAADLAAAPRTLVEDVGRVARPEFLGPLAIAGGVALVAKNSGDRMNDFFFERSILSKGVSDAADLYGGGALLLGSAAAWHLGSAALGDEESHADSKLMLRSLAATGVASTILKGIFNDQRPDGGPYGFPSGHSAMSMAAATTLQDLYGYEVGIPAMLAAGLVGLQRLDDSRHDIGDVVFGWTLGYVIAHSITSEAPIQVFGMDLGVELDPSIGSVAITLSVP